MGALDAVAAECNGDDILAQLNFVFGFPHMEKFKYAKEHNKFGDIPNRPRNYEALIDAYKYAGLEVTPRWSAYLRALGTVRSPNPEQGPQNIYDIAQFRDHGLRNGLGMRTMIHDPHDGGQVHTRPGSGMDPEIVDSPYPLPE